MDLMHDAYELTSQLTTWRRHLHQYPELSFKEHETQRYLLGVLKELGLQPSAIGGTGVTVELGHGSRGVAVRADIDALPLQEESTYEFRSRHDGVMHACGHDGHTAILLGVAALLAPHQDTLPGRVRLMFQPAEELIPGGALDLIQDGVLDHVDRVLGLHLASDLPTGQVGLVAGATSANADRFIIRIEGKGGHGSQPESAIDPLVVAADLLLSIQTIVSRNINPRHAAVVTVGTLEGGSNFNIIAPRATLTGTVRTFDPEDRTIIRQRLETLVSHICQAHGAQGELDYLEGYPSVVNTEEEAKSAECVVEKLLGPNAVVHPDPLMAGEDFAYYLQQRPGVFLTLGCQNSSVGAHFPHHHPQFTIDEQALPLGSAVLAATALEFLTMSSLQKEV